MFDILPQEQTVAAFLRVKGFYTAQGQDFSTVLIKYIKSRLGIEKEVVPKIKMAAYAL